MFSNKNQKTHGVFWFSNRNPTKHRVFWFFTRYRTRKPKNPCVCLVFHLKSKKPCDFLDFCWKTKKNPRKTKKSKSFGPLRKVWIFGFLVSAEGTTKPKIQKSKTLLRGPKLLDFLVFLGFFGLPTKIQKTHGVFLVFQQKSKKTRVFLGFSPETEQENQKNPVFFWCST